MLRNYTTLKYITRKLTVVYTLGLYTAYLIFILSLILGILIILVGASVLRIKPSSLNPFYGETLKFRNG